MNSQAYLKAEATYGEAISVIRDIFQSVVDGRVKYGRILDIISKIDSALSTCGDEMIILTERATPESYLYGHSVNICIISMLFGKILTYSYNDVEKLGISALLHDMGMIKLEKLVSTNKKLTPKEFLEVKKHPEYTVMLLDNIDDLPESHKATISTTVLQVHERKSGKGYPYGIKSQNIHEFARIISIVDTYEALTHPRNWHERYLPHEALKMLLEIAESDFDVNMVNLFINHFSLYPPGSYVRLNTKEIAKVVGINKGLPKTPIVQVIIDPTGYKAKEETVVDLAKVNTLHIIEPVDETNLKIPDKRLALKLKAQKWWIDKDIKAFD